ncbi:hypothetical protein LCGC14_0515020 [marine sediment metagenome]|uniref:Uncharacterized protein n=1 Tax=marine sediment metagenome TaxID=412755 RepID=A0A0F9ULM5_9ZZZZ
MKKWTLYIIMALLMFTIVSAIKECEDIQLVKEIPCQITATWNYTIPCNSHNATVYNSTNNNIINYTFQSLGESPLCVFDWNVTTLGSYSYIVDTGDTGNITVERQNNMIAIIIGLIFVMIFFLALGFIFDKLGAKLFGYGIAFIQLLNIVYILYINELNQSLAPILRINFISILWLSFGVGMISIIRLSISLISMGKGADDPKEDKKWGRG